MMAMFSQMTKITDYLYLSGVNAVTETKLRHNGISLIVSLTMDISNRNYKNIERIPLHVDDVPTANLSIYFDRCADLIKKNKDRGGRTLVHCIAGVSRSASICIVYFMKYHRMTLREAHAFVRARRPIIRPNPGFWRQLIDYERKLFGRTSVAMVSSPIGWIPDIYKAETKHMVW